MSSITDSTKNKIKRKVKKNKSKGKSKSNAHMGYSDPKKVLVINVRKCVSVLRKILT